MQTIQSKISAAYSKAGGHAEQALSHIRTVKMLDGEEHEVKKYSVLVKEAAEISARNSVYTGLAMGIVWCLMLSDYALSFWYGSELISKNIYNQNMNRMYTAGDILVVFFAIITGGFSLGQAFPCMKAFGEGQEAALRVLLILERTPLIINDPNGKRLENVQGNIVLKNVKFSYPNKQDH